MRGIFIALMRAVWSQLHVRMLLLTLVPFVLSVALWGGILWLSLQPMIDWTQNFFIQNNVFQIVGGTLAWLGVGALKAVVVPLLAMWVLLPLMILTALAFVGTIAMPVIVRHVGGRHYPRMDKRRGGSIRGSLWTALSSFCIFLVLWIVTLPLSLMPVLTFVIQPALWGWLTSRVMAYDALAEYADTDERRRLTRSHRWPLFAIGAATGALGAAPTLLWLGGALSVIFFPLLASSAILLYVLIFVFTGLWFEHYCLQALAQQRADDACGPGALHTKPTQPWSRHGIRFDHYRR